MVPSHSFLNRLWQEGRSRRPALAVLVALLIMVVAVSTAVAAQTIPTITIVSVERGQSVTIRTHNFPANRAFTARMGLMGTHGIGGTVVGTTNSGSGGTFDVTYTIPANLQNNRQISIRLEAGGGYYAYNWFYNNTTGAGNGTATPVPTPPGTGYTGIPTFKIIAVERDNTVTIRTDNFPANRSFTARMGAMGTRGIGGTVVGTTNSGNGGTFDASYDIPAGLQGSRQISIRLEASGGYYAYNWFYNNTTP